MISKNLPKDIASGVEGKAREGKAGRSNEGAAKGIKEADKANDSSLLYRINRRIDVFRKKEFGFISAAVGYSRCNAIEKTRK